MCFADISQRLHLHLQSNEKFMTVKLILYVIIKHKQSFPNNCLPHCIFNCAINLNDSFSL